MIQVIITVVESDFQNLLMLTAFLNSISVLRYKVWN